LKPHAVASCRKSAVMGDFDFNCESWFKTPDVARRWRVSVAVSGWRRVSATKRAVRRREVGGISCGRRLVQEAGYDALPWQNRDSACSACGHDLTDIPLMRDIWREPSRLRATWQKHGDRSLLP
jgi:hypothetical protein